MTKKTRRPRRRAAAVRDVRRSDVARVERDLEIQFRRIAQMQAEIDDIKRALARRSGD